MGYVVFQRDSKFRIPKATHQRALDRLKSLAGYEPIVDSMGPHFSFVRQAELAKAVDLADALQTWRWEPEQSEEDRSIIGIHFTGEKYGDEDLLFAAIAPYVEAGSYLEMIGEDGALWRWVFDGTYVYKIFAQVEFPQPTPDNRVEFDQLRHRILFTRSPDDSAGT